jgi:hypothetical protein
VFAVLVGADVYSSQPWDTQASSRTIRGHICCCCSAAAAAAARKLVLFPPAPKAGGTWELKLWLVLLVPLGRPAENQGSIEGVGHPKEPADLRGPDMNVSMLQGALLPGDGTAAAAGDGISALLMFI